jgi:hypothetical protein
VKLIKLLIVFIVYVSFVGCNSNNSQPDKNNIPAYVLDSLKLINENLRNSEPKPDMPALRATPCKIKIQEVESLIAKMEGMANELGDNPNNYDLNNLEQSRYIRKWNQEAQKINQNSIYQKNDCFPTMNLQLAAARLAQLGISIAFNSRNTAKRDFKLFNEHISKAMTDLKESHEK